jgi:hypothetical protein
LDILSETFGAKPATIIKEVEIYRDWYRPYITYSQPYAYCSHYYDVATVTDSQSKDGFCEANLSINIS